MDLTFPLAVVLSGGNALGAYQAGVLQVLQEANLEPDWVCGGSVGAINGAIIAGNAPDSRVAQLRAFWRPGEVEASGGPADEWRRTLAVSAALVAGRADAFLPRNLLFPGFPLGNAEPPSLFDTLPLRASLPSFVDFDRLNAGAPRFIATAVDLENGDDVVFDTSVAPIGPDHLRASAALLPVFPPVEIDGRLLGDAGISANLPLDSVLDSLTDERIFIVAVDLLPLAARRPATLTEVADRMQDLTFANQSRRAITAWSRVFAERAAGGRPTPAATLIHLVYADQGREVVGKAFDFSPTTLRDRWDMGARDATAMLAMMNDGRISIEERPGLHVHRLHFGPAT